MKLKFIPLLLLLPVLMLVLVACSGDGQPLDTPAPLPTATPTPTQVPPIATVAPLPPTPISEVVIKEVEVTAIPLPTYTPLPTHTPLPTYTPLPTLTPQVIIKEIVITATPMPSPIPTQTATLVPTTTPIPTQVPPTPTPTQVPTPTPTVTPTPTQSPPTPTPAPIPSPTPFSIPSSLLGIRVELVSSTQDFQQLTNVAQPDNGRNHIFVTEQTGQIHMFLDDSQTTETKIFLDIQNRISVEDNEEGLLGLAFDPEYSSNGYFYVYYSATEPRRSIVSRFSAHQNDTDMADPKSEIVVIEIPQPYGNHNGGQLAFGPDGYLYIGLGDGGAAWDPLQHGQNTNTLLGSILRIDVRNLSADNSYSIPSDNPFLGVVGMRDEIWAYGLRNPWRFSFDSATNLLWVGDVGQDRWEEINLVTKGLNYGWNIMEGRHCLNPNTECDDTGLEPPIVEYDHAEGCSITGGYVYRGTDIPWLVGTYVYGDFCSGKIWGLRYLGGSVVEQALLLDSDLLISSFGQSVDGVLYVLSRNDGIYRILPEE